MTDWVPVVLIGAAIAYLVAQYLRIKREIRLTRCLFAEHDAFKVLRRSADGTPTLLKCVRCGARMGGRRG